MTKAVNLESTIRRIVGILEKNKILFHLTGGLASSFYGEPRFTQDIDLVIQVLGGKDLDRFLEELSRGFIIDTQVIRNAITRKSLFQALDEETMIKVDFHVGEKIAGELKRSKTTEILPGLIIPIVSREDAILSKLIWIKEGSHKSRQDAKMMLKLAEAVDRGYMTQQAMILEVEDILNQLLEELESDEKSD